MMQLSNVTYDVCLRCLFTLQFVLFTLELRYYEHFTLAFPYVDTAINRIILIPYASYEGV